MIDLSRNELPFDWPAEFKDHVLRLAAEMPWNRYVDTSKAKLCLEKWALLLQCKVENLRIIPGVSPVLPVLIPAASINKAIYLLKPSFYQYSEICNLFGIEQLDISLPIDERVGKRIPNASTFLICSPNNPTGAISPLRSAKSLVNRNNCLLIADSTYAWFEEKKFAKLQVQQLELSHSIELLSFSKALGLAGFRVGIAWASGRGLEILDRVLQYFPVSVFQVSVLDALVKAQNIRAASFAVRRTNRARESLLLGLQCSGFRVWSTNNTNFVVIELIGIAFQIANLLKQKDVLTKPISKNLLRITVPKAADVRGVISSLSAAKLAADQMA